MYSKARRILHSGRQDPKSASLSTSLPVEIPWGILVELKRVLRSDFDCKAREVAKIESQRVTRLHT